MTRPAASRAAELERELLRLSRSPVSRNRADAQRQYWELHRRWMHARGQLQLNPGAAGESPQQPQGALFA